MSLANFPNELRFDRRQIIASLLTVLILSAGFAITYVLQQAALQSARYNQQLSFDIQVHELLQRVEQRLINYKQVLQATGGLFAASNHVSRSEFHAYVTQLDITEAYPGIQSIGFSELITRQQKTSHIEAVRQEGFSLYSVYPEGDRALYSPYLYVEPSSGRNLTDLGFDSLSEPLRRKSMEYARDSGKVMIMAKLLLLQETDQNAQAGFVMFSPIFKNDKPHKTVDERRLNIVGWAFSQFRMDDLMHGILDERSNEIGLEIYDGDKVRPESLMYHSDDQRSSLGSELTTIDTTRIIRVFEHPWTIKIHTLPSYDTRLDSGRAKIIVVSGSLLSCLLSLLVWQLANQRIQAIELANKMTHDLQESEFRWKIAIEGAGDGQWDWDLKNNKLFFSSRFKALLGQSDDWDYDMASWERCIHPDDKPDAIAQMQACLFSMASIYRTEYRVICKDGSWKWLL